MHGWPLKFGDWSSRIPNIRLDQEETRHEYISDARRKESMACPGAVDEGGNVEEVVGTDAEEQVAEEVAASGFHTEGRPAPSLLPSAAARMEAVVSTVVGLGASSGQPQ